MVITIGRTFGSGGRMMGQALAKKLGYKFYDKELVRMLSDETGINEALFGESDEKLSKTYIGVDTAWKKGINPLPPSDKKYASEGNRFLLEAQMINKLANTEDCVIMGRCAGVILAGRMDVVRLFCYADEHDCIKRTMEVCGLDEKAAIKRIAEVDKYRYSHFKHFTGRDLDDTRNYDLCINTGSRTVDQLVDIANMYISTAF